VVVADCRVAVELATASVSPGSIVISAVEPALRTGVVTLGVMIEVADKESTARLPTVAEDVDAWRVADKKDNDGDGSIY